MVFLPHRPVLRGKRNSSYSRLADTEKEELNSSLSRLCNEKNQPPLDNDNHCQRSTTRNGNNQLEIGFLDSRDPDNDVSSPVPLDVDGLSRFKKKRDTGSRVDMKKCTTHKGLRKKSKQRQCTSRRHSHSPRTPNERVSFAVGDNGNAVTSVNHYQLYSDAEKAACFYNDQDIRRFRSEHYLGITPECSKEQSSDYETVAEDFLSVVGDMWNSCLDMAYSSLHG